MNSFVHSHTKTYADLIRNFILTISENLLAKNSRIKGAQSLSPKNGKSVVIRVIRLIHLVRKKNWQNWQTLKMYINSSGW